MSPLHDLPKRNASHRTGARAERAFEALLTEGDDFLLQHSDRSDYGADYFLEVLHDDQATNVRLCVQLKGTEQLPHQDGSISVGISRANLNYLLSQPYSIYVCFHLPSGRLLMRTAESVLRDYEHGAANWTEQKQLTVRFSEPLTIERLRALATLARLSSDTAREFRTWQTSAPVSDIPDILRSATAPAHVPEDPVRAAQLLSRLYDRGRDSIITAAFDQFAAILGPDHDAMICCHIAEINLGMNDENRPARRIEIAVEHLQSRLATGRYEPGSLHYSIGNGWTALGKHDEAVRSFKTALLEPGFATDPGLAAQCHKNLASGYERLGEQSSALDHYREALRLDPHLPEAHYSLAQHHLRQGDYREALDHLDQTVFGDGHLDRYCWVAGWRVNALFNLGDGRGAFRQISDMLGHADDQPWVWSWCARQVAAFGRTNVENARSAVIFWERHLRAYPDIAAARSEFLLTQFYRRSLGDDIGLDYAGFRTGFEAKIVGVQPSAAAFLWDRLGHWAQDLGEWHEAERCFREAYAHEGGQYGYCLGTALNVLRRYEESLPLLTAQAEAIQPDALSWFQVAMAREGVGQTSDAIAAYRKALALDPDYARAMFNLGGLHWNSGEPSEARAIWREAVTRFPEHELAETVCRDFDILRPVSA